MSFLQLTVYLSFAGAAACFAAGPNAARARWIALASSVFGLMVAAIGWVSFPGGAASIDLVDTAWIPSLGVRYHLAVDGLSLPLVALTGVAAVGGILMSWRVERDANEFFALYLLLIAGVYGVFLSADAFVLFVFYEIAIVPKYFLIVKWGSTRREHGAMKLVMYSFIGSAFVLAGMLWAYGAGSATGFGLAELARANLGETEQIAIFGLVFFGFAVLAGLFPFHNWAPTGHVAAPTAASMLLAGVVMKLGAYGCLRVAMPLLPAGFAFWAPVIGWLAVAGILYAGLVALVQEDLKFVIGYSSVSHMGFVMLGLATGNLRGVSGAALQMVSHGLVAGLLFAIAGGMIYERTHTRKLAELAALPIHREMRGIAILFTLAGLASMGMPGFSGFPAELSILVGAWHFSPLMALGAALGVAVAAAFTLRAVQQACFGRTGETGCGVAHNEPSAHGHGDGRLTWPELSAALLLLGLVILLGLKPDLVLDRVIPVLQSPAFQAVVKGGVL
ncbi:NuoM family protein [Nibricoccus sp. IMCC34717]|uniref:complex I subunit 4 family protein n=1 Tax=Nibricoccus sp. IMCC34717 TaxID=3034021 RepID=UPI00384AEEB3